MGKNCCINCNIQTSESYLIELGDNVTISDHVSFVTHDNSISKVLHRQSDLYGKIKVGNDCFVGSHAILMYGVSLADHTIVASGSVVTKSVTEPYCIVGGNPTKVISQWNTFGEKNKEKSISLSTLPPEKKKERLLKGDLLITR